MDLKSAYSNKIKLAAQKLGFLSCGISKADFLEDEAPRLEQWLNQGHNGSMYYMERNFDKRLDPRILVPGAKSIVFFERNARERPKHCIRNVWEFLAPKLLF